MPEIAVNGETLHYERAGTGPTLLMLHSLGTNSYLWERQFAHWQERFTCIAFDSRGHGRSTQGPFTVRQVAADLHAAVTALDLLPVVMIGISMGGPVAARFHEIDPDAVRAIVYADSFAHMGSEGEARIRHLEETVPAMTMADYAADYAANTLMPATPQADREALVEAIAGMRTEDYLQAVRSIFTEDVSDCLKQVSVPMLVLVGENDQRTPLSWSREAADLVPGSALVQIPGAGHLSNVDNPDAFNAEVDAFLARALL